MPPRDSAPADTRTEKRPSRLWGGLAAGYTLALLIATHWPRLSVPSVLPQGIWAQVFPLDKLAHAGLFTVWTYLMLRAWPRRLGGIWAAAALSLVYAPLNELTQTLVPGRTYDLADAAANLAASLCVCLALLPRPDPSQATRIIAWLARLTLILAIPQTIPLAFTAEGSRRLLKLYADFNQPLFGTDKAVHFYTAFILTLTLYLAKPLGIHRPRASAALMGLVLALSASLLEIVQVYAGRISQPDLTDIWHHHRGFIAALLILTNFVFLRHFAQQLRHAARVVLGLNAPPTSQGDTPPPPESFVTDAALVSGLTLVSRFTGLIRDAVLAAVLGLSWIADAFFVGFLIPNLFRRLFGEGAITAAFIPRYTQLRAEDPDLAKRFVSACLVLLAVVLAAIVLLGEALLALIANSASLNDSTALTLQFARIMLPYMPLVCGVAFIGAVLQVHRRFGPPAAAPILLNLVMIGVAWLVGFGNHQPHANPSVTRYAAHAIAWSVVVAGMLQLAWMSIVLLRCTKLTRTFSGVRPAMRTMLVTFVPMLIGLGVFQVNALLDALIAWGLSPQTDLIGLGEQNPMQTGDVAALQWAQRLYQFPLGVFGVAIATAIFPALAAASQRNDDNASYLATLRQGLRLTVFIALPATAGLMLIALPAARMIYQRGAFDLADAQRVAVILTGYSASIWAYSLTHVLTRAFYAKDDPRTPLRVSLMMVAVNLTLNLILIWPLGAAGLAWSTACSASLGSLILLRKLRRHAGQGLVDAAVKRSWLHTALATAAMAGVIGLLVFTLDLANTSAMGNAVVTLGLTALGALIVLGSAWVLKRDELTWLTRRR